MSRLRAILRAVPPAELAEDAIGAVLLLVVVLGLPHALAIAATLLEGAQ